MMLKDPGKLSDVKLRCLNVITQLQSDSTCDKASPYNRTKANLYSLIQSRDKP